ncbi:CBF/Mak21 family-domain-containing protein [Coniochaeta sp. 2T2.1]|nr:CBF/Mak21 family-domain-containing protein [Coniochaeta sp. 2T2.1]
MAPRGKQSKPKGPKTFDESTLTQLTANIEKKLEGKPDWENKRPQHGGKRKRPDDNPNNEPLPKKRPTRKGPEQRAQAAQRPGKPAKTPTSTLLEEIKALGGDENDLELIENLDSDAEEGAGPKPKEPDVEVDDGFKNELAKFAASLGLEKLREEAEAESEEEDEVEEPEPEAEEEFEDVEEEEEEEAPQPPARQERPEPPAKEERKKDKNDQNGKLMFEPRPDWHAFTENLPAPSSDEIKHLSTALHNLKAHAKTLLDEDTAAYQKSQASSSTRKFMSTIMASGTMSDKVSALTLAIQESPVHNIKAFENLINLAGKKSRGQAIAALGALVDLLGNGVVLPADRRLRTFQTQPGLIGNLQKLDILSWDSGEKLPRNITKGHLVVWAYEDWLKDAYFRIIQLLEVWCGDEIEYSRSRALDFVFGLLRDKPEQEANLLRLLVNKLGDRDRKIASRASYLLLQLLNTHPGMKGIMVKTVEQEVLLRPGQSTRTKYYAINTLNQTILSMKEPAVADNLLRIYFEMFLTLLKSGSLGNLEALNEKKKPGNDKGKKGKGKSRGKPPVSDAAADEADTTQKLVSAILTGVNRAVPFATADDTTLEKHLDTLFRITHSSNFNTSIQALMLIQQLAMTKHLAVERFYRTLYESLLDPRLITSSKQALYLNLLYRSLKNDVDVRRVKAFVKRMLQIINLHQAAFACGILFLVAELGTTFPDLKTLLIEPEYHGEDDEEVYKDADVSMTDATAPTPVVDDEAPKRHPVYDGRKRDPEYSNADKSCLWEIIPFLSHFHPSVAVFAENVFIRQKSLPKPELANHTLMHFLDKFVYRNPKATDGKRGGSIMQPVGSASATNIVVPGKAGSSTRSSVNTASFWNLKQAQVAKEDVFFHEYFSQIGKPAQAAKKAKKETDENASEDEEAEEDIWDALVKSRPEVGGAEGEEDDEDVDFAGLEDIDYGSDVSVNLDDSDLDDDLSDGGADLGSDAGEDGGFEGIFGGSDEEGGEWEDEDAEEKEDEEDDETAGKSQKWKERRARKKEMKGLPTFASAEDYAAMLGQDDDLDDPNL